MCPFAVISASAPQHVHLSAYLLVLVVLKTHSLLKPFICHGVVAYFIASVLEIARRENFVSKIMIIQQEPVGMT